MFENLRNEIDFFIRNKTKFSRKNFVETNSELIERNRLENLYTKEILSKYFNQSYKKQVRILDIGCKNWFYAKGEIEFFKNFCEEVFLDGVEIDAFRLYSNFYSRYEVAKFYTKGLENTNYIADNLLNIKEKYDYIVWILPFVIKEPHKYWGLPEKYFYPEKLLQHAYSLLKENGEMLIINQGKTESQVQKLMLEKLNIRHEEIGEIKSEYFEYKNKRFGYFVKKY